MLTGLEPLQITNTLKIDLFNRHLFKREIKKSASKSNHRNCKEAFDATTNAEKQAKRFEGLSNNGAAIMAAKADLHKVNQVNASTHPHQQGTYMKPYNSTKKKKKSDNNCFRCGERGHYA